jgi:hypothetical protein
VAVLAGLLFVNHCRVLAGAVLGRIEGTGFESVRQRLAYTLATRIELSAEERDDRKIAWPVHVLRSCRN